MNRKSNKNISKSISYFLRHRPEEIGLVMDETGTCSLKELVNKVNAHFKMDLSVNDYIDIFKEEEKDKKRYEYSVKNDYIRAFYGHSYSVEKDKTDDVPSVLYHGTSREAYKLILTSGIKKMNRDKVHLSETQEMAIEVGKRHDDNPIIISIDTTLAIREGVQFYKELNGVYLADFIPLTCIY